MVESRGGKSSGSKSSKLSSKSTHLPPARAEAQARVEQLLQLLLLG